MVLGKRPILTASFEQKGHMRLKKGQKWLRFSAHESMTTSPPGFVWRARATMFPGLWVSGEDSYVDGRGAMVLKLLSLVRIGEERGKEMNQSGLLRFLCEVPIIPTF
jgi:hypothetical protein